MSSSVPAGWTKTNIGKLTKANSIFNDGDWVESKDQDESGLNRLIQLADIGDGHFVNKSARFMNDEQFNRLKCTPLQKGDILIARMPDPLGRACIFPLEGGKFATVVDVALIRTENADHYWLMSAINSSGFRFHIDLNASGTTRTRIARGALSQIPLLAPPLPEQQKIAAILTSVDDVIESTQAQINKLKDLKTGMMQELLTEGIGHTEFKDSPVGRIPKAWEVLRCVDVCEKITDGEHLSPKYVEHGFPILSAKDILTYGIDFSGAKQVSEADFKKMLNRCNPELGDVLIVSRGATIGKTTLNISNKSFALMGSVILLKPLKDKCVGSFLSLLIAQPEAQREMMLLSGSSAQQAIYLKDIKDMYLRIPPLDEQKAISQSINSIDQKIIAKTLKYDALNKIKKALMQDLLTGKVRVKVN